VPDTIEIARPETEFTVEEKSRPTREPGFLVICWNDPVNLMAYVTHVFQTVFAWERQKAEKHMREVHEKGKSVLTRDSFEKAEFYVHQLQKHSLQATLEPAE
jgi:ATP-dependent Clp protease adaptor protein ClpS